MTESQTAADLLRAIVKRERDDGCPMADEGLIAPILRRWNSYERRFRKHKAKGLQHRAHDLEKGLRDLFPDHRYDPGCLRHLARSFAEVLLDGVDGNAGAPHETPGDPA